jgi:uncharacterized alpha-E superfamily protein
MLARIAYELFWLGRDLSRAEHTARTLDGAYHADVAGIPGEQGIALSWEAVLEVIGAKPPGPGEASADEPESNGLAIGRTEVSQLLTLDPGSPASIVSCVGRARERGRALRDVISTEMWEALNGFHLGLGLDERAVALATSPYSVFQGIKERCALFWGLVGRTMLRDEGRAFLQAGGRIEEADMVLRMLRVAVPDEPWSGSHDGDALALLHAVGGFQAYRRSVRNAPSLGEVVRFLLYETEYPGSVAASVQTLSDALAAADVQPRASAPVLRLGRLIADMELQRRMPGPAGLRDTVAAIQDELERIDRAIADRYFAVAAAVHL